MQISSLFNWNVPFLYWRQRTHQYYRWLKTKTKIISLKVKFDDLILFFKTELDFWWNGLSSPKIWRYFSKFGGKNQLFLTTHYTIMLIITFDRTCKCRKFTYIPPGPSVPPPLKKVAKSDKCQNFKSPLFLCVYVWLPMLLDFQDWTGHRPAKIEYLIISKIFGHVLPILGEK